MGYTYVCQREYVCLFVCVLVCNVEIMFMFAPDKLYEHVCVLRLKQASWGLICQSAFVCVFVITVAVFIVWKYMRVCVCLCVCIYTSSVNMY